MNKKQLFQYISFVSFISIAIISFAVIIEPAEYIHDYFHSTPSIEQYELDDVLIGLFISVSFMLICSLKQLRKSLIKELLYNRKRSELRALLDSLSVSIAKLNNKQQLTLANPSFNQLRNKIGDTAIAEVTRSLLNSLNDEHSTSSIKRKHQSPFLSDSSSITIRWSIHKGSDNNYLLQADDISQEERNHQKLDIAQQIINNTPIGVMVVNESQIIEYVNRSFELITGYSKEDIIDQSPSILKSGKHDSEFYTSMYQTLQSKGTWQGEIWNRKKNGDVFLEWLSISTLKNSKGRITHCIGMFSEITAQEHFREKLHTLAYYDPLTSLANRTLFSDRLSAMIQNKRKKTLCVVFIDLDGFKRINDSLGHDVGDQLLVTFAKRLKLSIRSSDIVARWGGDEFILAIEVTDTYAGISRFCNKQLNILEAPFLLSDRELNITASIGVSVYGEDAQTAKDLIRNADIAMYQAKQHGKNRYEIFSSQLRKDISEKIEIEYRLRRAIHYRHIEVYFQPQVELSGNNIIGLEALARWTDEELGYIPPQTFISIAEDTGLIGDLSALILDKALEQFKYILEVNPAVLLSINLSASQLQDDNLVDLLEAKINQSSIEPRKIKLEITEDLFISNIKKSIQITSSLKKLGFIISLDDFGTGYSSLSYLKDFDIDELKIDRSFVTDIENSERNQAIISAMLVMSKVLSINCIVEGVETEDQLSILKNLGCNLFQGYLFYKPMPHHEIDLIFENKIPTTIE